MHWLLLDFVVDLVCPYTFLTNDSAMLILAICAQACFMPWTTWLCAGFKYSEVIWTLQTPIPSSSNEIIRVERSALSDYGGQGIPAGALNFSECTYENVWLTLDPTGSPHHPPLMSIPGTYCFCAVLTRTLRWVESYDRESNIQLRR